MKLKLLSAVIFSITCNISFAADGTTPMDGKSAKEDQCQKVVMSTLEALEAESDKTGKEAKIKDLSALDIMNMAKSKGVCTASDAIESRKK
jgi:hypothetical protein